ncbi:hemerythrin family protein [Neptuniibacter sp.]|uniref:hemerythrin family protein n=1 Tax=Neptuniibacter sp. TaxID=1962643 RepID=UPI00262DC7AE|nr:hemerythrin family protein [Neptuniibacter sp.]MCP4595346.1 hemerythrin family protein [Neptuniibacter sp.]
MTKTSELIWQDQQHQVLFELIDEIKADHVDSSTFERLNDYAEHHFLLEEAYMKALNYPGFEDHLQAHNKFRVELGKMLDDHHTYNSQLRDMLSDFLSEWLKRHIFGVDKKLEEFILNSECK